MESVTSIGHQDVEEPLIDRETFLNNSPSHVGGMIKIPPVIEFEE